MAALSNRRSYTFDANLQFKDAGLVAASAAAQVSSAAQILNVGNSPVLGVAVIDASSIEIGTGDEMYTLIVQGSTSPTFAGTAAVDLAAMRLGHATPLGTGEQSTLITSAARFELPFINVQNDVVYPYLRMYTIVVGTIATGINYKAFAAIMP